MPGLVYILCALTSLGSATLLFRGALRRRDGLLFWSALCFVAMAVNNAILYANFILLPDVDLLTASRLATLVGILVLNFGLIWHSR
jgi:hypothetical protein